MVPRLYIGLGKVLYIGIVEHVPVHRCIAPVYAAGLDRAFAVQVDGEEKIGRTLFVAAGVDRSVDAFGQRLAVLLIDPGMKFEIGPNESRILESLEQLSAGFDASHWRSLSEELGSSYILADAPEAVLRTVELITEKSHENLSAANIAAQLGMSSSRLEHLFTRHAGIPMRSFRMWVRFRNAAQILADGGNLTDAAHSAGFYDSAHFNHAFKRAFGLGPSVVFATGVKPYVIGIEGDASRSKGAAGP